jgi:hypothetical protein
LAIISVTVKHTPVIKGTGIVVITSMDEYTVSNDFVREYISSLRNRHNKTYQMTWNDVSILFKGKVDASITGTHGLWRNKKKFEWMVDDVSVDRTLDCVLYETHINGEVHRLDNFIVDIAKFSCTTGRYAILSMGVGSGHPDKSVILSYYDKDGRVIWRCQACIVESGIHGIWQAGSILMDTPRSDRSQRVLHTNTEKRQRIRKLQMVSKHYDFIDQMIYNRESEVPQYALDESSQMSPDGFFWSRHNPVIWENAMNRDTEIRNLATIDADWWDDFTSEIAYFEFYNHQDNPDNKCSMVPSSEP